MNLPADKMAVNNTVASYGLINLQFELKPTTQLTWCERKSSKSNTFKLV
jgi:hypothetical protein